MTKSESFSEFCNLIRLYEGVEIDHWHERDGFDKFCLTLRISDPKSIVRLQDFSLAVNINCSVYAEGSPTDTESAADTLRRLVWTFVFPRNESNDLSEDLKHFGIFMVWDLQKRGILDKNESTRLLELWGGAQRVF
jgi:hypothetical protein